MNAVEFCWLIDQISLKGALQDLLGCSGQLLKKNFSSKELLIPIRAQRPYRLPLNLVNHKKINPIYLGPDASVLAEQENYLVIHKPANIHSHPHEYSDKNTILNFLTTTPFAKYLEVNPENYDRGLLYRLDFETSGLLLMAKSTSYYDQIRVNFNQLMKSKYYLAVVDGEFNKDGFHQHSFKAIGEKGSKQKVLPAYERGDALGELEVRLVDYQEGKSLLLVNLHSGLRHQIRAQLAYLGFPILGDTLYGGHKAQRLFLHAYRYEFESIEEDRKAELFDSFFDLNRCFQMCHDMFSLFNRR